MMGRNAKPIEMHILEDNKNRLTKKQIKNRKDSQIKLGTKIFEVPEFIKDNSAALEKWEEVIEEYINANVEFVTSADTGLIARYCLAYSEYLELVDRKKKILEEFKNKDLTEVQIVQALNKLNLDNPINKKSELILKMEGQLFLTPLAKVKNIPVVKPDSKQTNMLKELGFDNV